MSSQRTYQQTLSGGRNPDWYLMDAVPSNESEPLNTEPEAYCRHCRNRVTRSNRGSGEWGHSLSCNFHISGGVMEQ